MITIRELRRARRWTQEGLARRVGMGFVAVSKWENGHETPSVAQPRAPAKVAGVPSDAVPADSEGR